MEKIDILIATYNGEKYIKEQLESILNQSYKNINIIISDDNSTDNTARILKEFENVDSRIKIYYQNDNLGLVSNFQFLLQKVSSKYYMLSDQDDVWNIKKVEESLEKLQYSNADLVFTDLEIVDEKLNHIYDSFTRKKGLYHKIIKNEGINLLYLNNVVTGCTILTKSSWLNKTLPIPLGYQYMLHDYWIALIIAIYHGKIVYLDKPLLKYRQHEANLVGSKRSSDSLNTFDELRNLFLSVKIEHFDLFVKKKEHFEDYYKILNDKALIYFKSIKNKKYINFKGLTVFHTLYKHEGILMYIVNFTVLNLPIVARFAFYFRKLCLKIKRK